MFIIVHVLLKLQS